MKRNKARIIQLNAQTKELYDYYLKASDRFWEYPKESDLQKGDIILINWSESQTSLWVADTCEVNGEICKATLKPVMPF